jgi:hypothetical protein
MKNEILPYDVASHIESEWHSMVYLVFSRGGAHNNWSQESVWFGLTGFCQNTMKQIMIDFRGISKN